MFLGFWLLVLVGLTGVVYFIVANSAFGWLQYGAVLLCRSTGVAMNPTQLSLLGVAIAGLVVISVLGFAWKRYTSDFSF